MGVNRPGEEEHVACGCISLCVIRLCASRAGIQLTVADRGANRLWEEIRHADTFIQSAVVATCEIFFLFFFCMTV